MTKGEVKEEEKRRDVKLENRLLCTCSCSFIIILAPRPHIAQVMLFMMSLFSSAEIKPLREELLFILR